MNKLDVYEKSIFKRSALEFGSYADKLNDLEMGAPMNSSHVLKRFRCQ